MKKHGAFFLQSVPEEYRMYLEQALDAVGFEETDNPKIFFGYLPFDKVFLGRMYRGDMVYFNPRYPQFFTCDFSTVMTHELGHRIDHFFVQSEEMGDFLRIIQEGMDTVLTHEDEFIRFCKEHDREGYLSDILSGLCKDEVRFPFYHEKWYWERPRTQPKEIFANIFSLYAFDDSEKIAFLEQHFPGLVDIYQKII